jgi:hypothetical protein
MLGLHRSHVVVGPILATAMVAACSAPADPADGAAHAPASSSEALTTGLQLLPPARLQAIKAKLPVVEDATIAAIFKGDRTIWYDHTAIIPGYQDSFGDNVELPIGFRPNTIAAEMIDLAVPGGHAELFVNQGHFNFPFETTGGADDAANAFVVDFWVPPLDAAGQPLPVVYWEREPNEYTHRYEWLFPKGTVFGEVLFLTAPSGEFYTYEVRSRTRDLDGWHVDVFRPFPRAEDLANAVKAAQKANPAWNTTGTSELLQTLESTGTLVPSTLAATHFQAAWSTIQGASDVLPAFDDVALPEKLLASTTFRSAKGIAWKSSGTLTAWAATTSAAFSVVPKGYKGGFLSVDDTTCSRCHADAGHPFVDYYPEVEAYGELWGMDEVFSWHPFEASQFVDANGGVLNFDYDNRVIRQDFTDAGLVARYDATKHAATVYKEIPRAWHNFAY